MCSKGVFYGYINLQKIVDYFKDELRLDDNNYYVACKLLMDGFMLFKSVFRETTTWFSDAFFRLKDDSAFQ